MEAKLNTADKFDIQQNYRRYLRLKDQHTAAQDAHNYARAEKIWIAGVITLPFAVASTFFLGVSAGLFGVYFYSLLKTKLRINEAAEGLEQLDRWFSKKRLSFEGKVMYALNDRLLENPIDPFDDQFYAQDNK